MKKIIALLTIIVITAAVILFPDIYYSKADEGIKKYHRQESYNLNRVDDINLQKKIDILTDADSLYIDKTIDTSANDEKNIVEIINQIEDIVQIEVDESSMAKTATKNGVKSIQVINSSSYNVYSIDLRIIRTEWEEYDFTIVYDANEKKILYVEILCTAQGVNFNDDDNAKHIADRVKKYYGELTDCNYEILSYCVVFNAGSPADKNVILNKLKLEFEEETEMDIYDDIEVEDGGSNGTHIDENIGMDTSSVSHFCASASGQRAFDTVIL